MTSNVLDNIKRINLKEREIVAAIDFAREHQLMLVSELIFGLPGETIDSFFQSIDRLMDYRFESVAIAQLRILLGTEMDLPEYLERYEVQIMYAMSENGYTSHPEMENIEIDQWAVSNNTLTHEEYLTVIALYSCSILPTTTAFLRKCYSSSKPMASGQRLF